MSGKELVCPKCESLMVEGLIIEHKGGQKFYSLAKKSFHWGLEMKKAGFRSPKVLLHAISPFRCQNCGYLEFHALTEDKL